jgi:hypothetical protein
MGGWGIGEYFTGSDVETRCGEHAGHEREDAGVVESENGAVRGTSASRLEEHLDRMAGGDPGEGRQVEADLATGEPLEITLRQAGEMLLEQLRIHIRM